MKRPSPKQPPRPNAGEPAPARRRAGATSTSITASSGSSARPRRSRSAVARSSIARRTPSGPAGAAGRAPSGRDRALQPRAPAAAALVARAPAPSSRSIRGSGVQMAIIWSGWRSPAWSRRRSERRAQRFEGVAPVDRVGQLPRRDTARRRRGRAARRRRRAGAVAVRRAHVSSRPAAARGPRRGDRTSAAPRRRVAGRTPRRGRRPTSPAPRRSEPTSTSSPPPA